MVYRIGPGLRWWKKSHAAHLKPSVGDEQPLYCFRMVPADAVPESNSELAWRVIRFVSQKLNLDPVQLRWFTQDPDRFRTSTRLPEHLNWQATECAVGEFEFPYDPTGYTPASRQNEIWIRTRLERLVLILAISHELKHVHQKADARERFESNDLLTELDAYIFASAATEEFLRFSGATSDSEIQIVRNFEAMAIRNLAWDAARAGMTVEEFRQRLSG
jgi:hypothetical protein